MTALQTRFFASIRGEEAPADSPDALSLVEATTPDALDRVFRLRYRLYLQEGYISPCPDERFTDRYDPWSVNYTVQLGSRPIGTVRMIWNSPIGFWTEALFNFPRPDLPAGVRLIDDPAALAEIGADLVIEAAGRASVLPWGRAALAAGADFAPASTSALTDPAILGELRSLAIAHGRQVLVPPGALRGVDALAAASRLPLDSVRHEIVKPPAAWAGSGAEDLCDLAELGAPSCFLEASAGEAAARFPNNANVAAISALAGLGLERTTVALIADPGASRNIHRIVARGAFGTLKVTLENHPLADNPRSSALTALSLVRLVENRTAPIVI